MTQREKMQEKLERIRVAKAADAGKGDAVCVYSMMINSPDPGKLYDLVTAAEAMYDGGWRASDREIIISEYNFTADEAAVICAELANRKTGGIL